ncbi:MAG: single-stranded DNA-binding protein [Candidatus Moranbacteria bacterium]|nr:single-stranded DNA-binding protein [Candidatus Moranbacteria bacterium]
MSKPKKMNVNKVILVGRLTKDPEARTTPSGKPVTSITVATSSIWKDESGNKQEKTEFHDIVLWGKLAEISAQYLIKGQEVYIEGKLETRNWEGKDGIKRYKTEIILSGLEGKMQMGSKPQGAQNRSSSPQSNNQQKSTSKTKTNQSKSGQDEEEIKIEDIPF